MKLWVALLGFGILGCASPYSQEPGSRIEIGPDRSVQECEGLPLAQIGAVDVAVLIDVSSSTAEPSGSDINMNGKVGESRVGKTGGVFKIGSTDPGDSILVAQIVAAKALLGIAEETDARFSIVSFSGPAPVLTKFPGARSPRVRNQKPEAVVVSELTSDLSVLEGALDEVLASGSRGSTRFATGMTYAIQTLNATDVSERSPRKFALLMSDSPHPVLPQPDGTIHRIDPAMREAARAAIDSQIVFNTFGLGQASTDDPPHALDSIARATGGIFEPIENASHLYCDLVDSIISRN
jgi:hypothetical protein